MVENSNLLPLVVAIQVLQVQLGQLVQQDLA